MWRVFVSVREMSGVAELGKNSLSGTNMCRLSVLYVDLNFPGCTCVVGRRKNKTLPHMYNYKKKLCFTAKKFSSDSFLPSLSCSRK